MKYFIISEKDIIGSKDLPYLSQEVTDYLMYKAMANHKSFEEILNGYLKEKMNEDVAAYLKFVDEAMGG